MQASQQSLASLLVDGAMLVTLQVIPLAGAMYIERRHGRYPPDCPSGTDPLSLPEGPTVQTDENRPLAG